MAFSSLFTLLDDIAAIMDDVALMTKMAAKKTAGVVGDDLALNANQVTGATAERELPIIWAVAKGALLNKVILIPIALLLSAFLPALITPLLMLGGAYLCFEGVEKLLHKFLAAKAKEEKVDASETVFNEKEKVRGAIRTDFILSAEIIIIALGVVSQSPLYTQIITLSVIGIGITLLVYGLVALIVKTDDFGLYLIQREDKWSALGNGILIFMPKFMRGLSIIGTIAMFLVGGGIFTHSLTWLYHWLEQYHLVGGWAGTLADLAVGVVIGAIVCALVLPLMKLFGKGH